MTTCSEYADMLDAAKTALHDVTLGNKVAVMQFGSKSIEYSRDSNIGELRAYIRELQGHVDACNGVKGRRRFGVGCMPTDC